jgi:XTP/dITP diphosphohydrolase
MNRKLDVVVASANEDKVREMREILPDGAPELWARINFHSMREAGFAADILEDGRTFAENALIKAKAVHATLGGYVLADDSGLAVDVLDGAPGIYSARFAGENAGYPAKIAKLHEMLQLWPPDQWLASFICVIALIRPDGSVELARGECRGRIAERSSGRNGFGYDPVFYLPDRGLTLAELPAEEKHRISHRGQALRQMAAVLLEELSRDGQ